MQADEVYSSCTATTDGVSGSATFLNGTLTLSTDAEGGPATSEPIPQSPPPNYTRSVTINNVGGHPTIVFNQQVVNPDGSFTVNGYHMYLFGPTAVGEQIVGQVTCGTVPSPLSSKDSVKPTCGIPVIALDGPSGKPLVPEQQQIGVFDTGGLAKIDDVEVTNGKVQVGKDPGAAYEYLKFVPGQTGPLTLVVTQTDPARPTSFSFKAMDRAGNKTRCEAGGTPPTSRG